MRIIFILLYIFHFFPVKSQLKEQQQIRLGYLYTFYPDSTKPSFKRQDYMYLDILTDSGTIFYSKDVAEKAKLLKRDEALAQEMIKSGVWDANIMMKYVSINAVEDVIIKYTTSRELIFGTYVGRYLYYKEPIPNMKWELDSDTLSINGFLCQKATTIFGGRTYTAWFSRSIEISDGPWKFSGLPGGIVKIYDTQNYFTYELKEIINLKQEKIELKLNEDAGFYPSTKKKLLQLMKSYYEDPTATSEALGITSSNSSDRKNAPKYYNPQERE